MKQIIKTGPLGGLFTCVLFLLALSAPAGAAGGWAQRTVDNLTLELPADWRALSAKNLKASPFRAAWFTGDEEHPDAGVAIFQPSFMPDIRKKLAADKYATTTVGGRPARRYFIDFEGGGKSTSYVSIVAGAAPGGKDWALMHFAPTPKWPAHQATLERVIASVRFAGAAAPAPAKTPPASTGGSTVGGKPVDYTGSWKTKSYVIDLRQGGNRVAGTYPHDKGRISGTVSGREMRGTWSESPSYKPPRDAGECVLVMSADGNRYQGKWRYGSSGQWHNWDAVRVSSGNAASGAATAGYYQLDFLTRYNMKRPEGTYKLDGIPVSGHQGGNAHVVWLAKGKTPADRKTPYPDSFSWPAPSYRAKDILIASNLAWWGNNLKGKPVLRLTVRGSGGARTFDLVVGSHTAEWNGGAITPAAGVKIVTGVPGPSRRWFVARFPLGDMTVTGVELRLLDAARWGSESAVAEIHGITLVGGAAGLSSGGAGSGASPGGGASGSSGGASSGGASSGGGSTASGGSAAGGQGSFGSSTYRAVLTPGGITWDQAKAAAQKAGGHLAVITSQAENDFVYKLVAGDDRYWYVDSSRNGIGPWLGGYQPAGSPEPRGGWRWITGEPFSFTRWASAEPNNSGGNENSLHFFGPGTLKGPYWNDLGGASRLKGYIIEFSKQGASGSATPSSAKPTLRLGQPSYRAGQAIRVIFDGFPGNAKDWIAVTKADLPDNKYGQWFYLAGKKGGALAFKALPAGSYQVRAYLNWPAGGYKVAERLAFTVSAGAASGGAASGAGAGLRLDKTTYAPGESIRVSFTAPGSYASNAWVGIIPSHVAHGKEAVNDRYDLTYQYLKKRTSGVLVFKAPTKAGAYDLRMHDTDNWATGRETASVSFQVAAGSSSGGNAPATPPTAGGSTVSVPSTAAPAGGGYWRLVKITGAPRKLGTHQCYQYSSKASEGTATYSIRNVCMKPHTSFSGVVHWQRPPSILYPGKPFSITLSATRTSRDTRLSQSIHLGAALEPERIPCGYTAGTSNKMSVSVGSGSAQDKVSRTQQFKMPDGGPKPRRLAWLYCSQGWSQQYVYEWVPKGQTGSTTGSSASPPTTTAHPPVTSPPPTVPPPTAPPVTSPPTTAPPVKTDYSRAVVIRPSKPVYRPDEPIVVQVSGLPAFPQMHVSIGPAGTTEFKTNQNLKTNARPEGTFTFNSRPVGKYRIIVWPDPNIMRYSILKTAEVEVKAPPLTAAIEQPKVEYNTGEKRIKVTVRPDSLVFAPAVLVAVPKSAPSQLADNSQVKFQKRFPGLKNIPMTVDAVVGLQPGQYEWRLYQPDPKGRIVARLPFSVVALGPDSPLPADMAQLPFSDRFSPGAECWRTEGLGAVVKDYTLTVNTARKPLATAFSIPLENVSVFFKFKAAGQTVRARWGAVKGQGYGLAIVPSQSGPATVYIHADGMAKSLARGQAPLAAGAWHSVYLRRAGDDLELRIDGKLVAEAKTARRYKGGAPLLLEGGEGFAVREVEVLYPNDAPHGGGYQKKDAKHCRCGPRILENWLGGLQQNGWRMTSGPEPKISHQFLKSETQVSGPRLYKGIRMLRVKAEAAGKGSCRPPSVRAVFKVGKANSATAYLETFVVLGLGEGSHNFPHLVIELLDDQGKVLGSQRFYSPAASSQASRENAERRKYVKLTRSAGVVRLNLKDVKKDVEFSQVAISLVNYVCDGDNDIAVDQILFCPSGDCGLTMTEVIDQAQVLAEIERLFVDFEITAEELHNYYIAPPKVEPRPQPPLKPSGSSRLDPALYWEYQPAVTLPLKEGDTPCCNRVALRRAAASANPCDKAMDKTIKDMRRMQVSLGHDNQLKKALWDMAKTLVKDLDLGPGGVKQAQEWVGWVMDEGEFAYDAYGDVQAGKTKEAIDKAVMHFSVKAFQHLHKKLLDECQKGLQLKKFSKQMRSAWAKSLMKLPPAQRRAELARLKHVFGAQLSDDEFHRWVQKELFGQVKDVDIGKAGGEAAGGEYKEALATIVSTTATAFSPQVRIAKAALTTYYESLRYMRDVITDDRTQDLYTAYRNWYDGGTGSQAAFDGHALRDRYPLHKVRTLLAKQKGTTHDKVSDDEAWKYLMGEFGKWRASEIKAEQQSDTLAKLKAQFQSLPAGCRRGLDKILWPQGKYGVTHTYRKNFDPCYYDVEALKAYGRLYRDIMRDLKTWARPSMKCGGAKFYDDTTARLACKFLTDGPEAYKRAMAYTLKSCDWLPKPKVVVLSANEARLAKRLTRGSETRLQVLLRGIGREDLLGCLCGQGVLMGVAGGYRPMPLPDSPACKNVGNGLCAAGNWGCYRFPVPMTAEALQKCGVFDAIIQWQIQRRKASTGR